MKYIKVSTKLLAATIENDTFWRKKAEFIYRVLLNKVKKDEFDEYNEIYIDPNEMGIESLNGLCVSFSMSDSNAAFNTNAEFVSHPSVGNDKNPDVNYFTLNISITKKINNLSDMYKMLSSSEYRIHILHELIHFLDFKERKIKSMNTSDNKFNKFTNSINDFNSLSIKEKEVVQNFYKKYLSHGLELNAYFQSIISNLISRTKRETIVNYLKNPPDKIKNKRYPTRLLYYLCVTQPQIKEIVKISKYIRRKLLKRLIPVYEQYFKKYVEN